MRSASSDLVMVSSPTKKLAPLASNDAVQGRAAGVRMGKDESKLERKKKKKKSRWMRAVTEKIRDGVGEDWTRPYLQLSSSLDPTAWRVERSAVQSSCGGKREGEVKSGGWLEKDLLRLGLGPRPAWSRIRYL